MKLKDTKITVLILISTAISVLVCLSRWVDKNQTKKIDIDTICEELADQINHLQS
mgnify:FL=1